MANQPKFHTYFLIESHPASLGKDPEVKLDMKHPGAQPLRKVLEKKFNLADGKQDFIMNVYAGDIMTSLIKDKEIKTVHSNLRTFPIKIVLKAQKNKFESKINPYIDFDCFMPFVKYEEVKKLIGKSVDPPPQVELSPFNYITLFNEALQFGLKKQLNDPTYLEFLRFSVGIMKTLNVIPLKLFLFVYEKILYTQNPDLMNLILGLFDIKKIENAKTFEEINIYKEALMMIYNNQVNYIELIKMIPNVNFLDYLIRFYTIFIFYHFQFNDIPTIENIMLDLRDKNPYDVLILPKMFLSQFNYFFRSLQINPQIKMSLIDGYIQASFNFDNILTAFSMITEYVQGDFNTILMIINQNYDKINQICAQNTNRLNINDYIAQKYEDDLSKIQENLITLGQHKLNYGYKAVTFNINMWDIYFTEGRNPDFLEFLKSHLIQTSLYLDEIKEALGYIIKYTRKDMVLMLELFVKNYDRIEFICKNEKKYINAQDYITPNVSDNIDAIKVNFDYIVSRKIKSNFESIYFKIDLWLFYILNDFNQEFLLYMEKKLFEGVIYYDDIIDCLTYGANQRHKTFSLVLKFIIENFDKINDFTQRKNACIDITKYFDIRVSEDNLEEIQGLLGEIIELEKKFNYKTLNFPITIWEPYAQSQDLDYLRLIRKMIIKLTEMDMTLNENDIGLAQKIHDIGFSYIRQGKLVGDRLLEFLGMEEAFYNQYQIKEIMETNKHQQEQLDNHMNEINYLKEQNRQLTGRVTYCEREISNLKSLNSSLQSRIGLCENTISNLTSRIISCESGISSLRLRPNY